MSRTIEAKEHNRLTLQADLDAKKTQPERNRLGQFATPTALAEDILQYAASLLPPSVKVYFLDPAIGTGSFYSALLKVLPKTTNRRSVWLRTRSTLRQTGGAPLERHGLNTEAC